MMWVFRFHNGDFYIKQDMGGKYVTCRDPRKAALYNYEIHKNRTEGQFIKLDQAIKEFEAGLSMEDSLTFSLDELEQAQAWIKERS